MAANKKRISQISKETGVQNRVLVEKAQEIGLLVKSHSSSVGPGEERRLLEALNVKPVVVEKMDSPKTLARVEIKENGDTFNVELWMMLLKICSNKFKMQEFQLWIKMEIQVLWLL